MKQIIRYAVTCCLLLFSATLQAQTILHIAPGGQLYIKQNTIVSFDSLLMLPLSGITLGENDISKRATPLYPFNGTYLNRVYCFSHLIEKFKGAVGIVYSEDEIKNVDEKKLLLHAYHNNWRPLSKFEINSAKRNVVAAAGINLNFTELLLGYATEAPKPEPDSKDLITKLPLIEVPKAVSLYPNPARDVVHIQVSGMTDIRSVRLFDASGKMLMAKVAANNNVYTFNIANLASGYYTIILETKTDKISKSFFKN